MSPRKSGVSRKRPGLCYSCEKPVALRRRCSHDGHLRCVSCHGEAMKYYSHELVRSVRYKAPPLQGRVPRRKPLEGQLPLFLKDHDKDHDSED